MKVDIEGLREEVVPWLEKAIYRAENVEEICRKKVYESGDVWTWMGWHTKQARILDYKNRIKDYKIWVENKISDFTAAEENNKQKISEISKIIDFTYKDNTRIKSREILEILLSKGVDTAVMTVDEFFKYFASENNGSYGVLQSSAEIGREESDRIRNLIMQKYNMSCEEATALMQCYNNINLGACSYAAAAGCIFAEYKNNPTAFESDFGFAMYKKTKDGKIDLNQEELLIDIYVYINSHKDYVEKKGYDKMDSLLDIDDNGIMTVDEELIDIGSDGNIKLRLQQYVNRFTLYDYLKSKNSPNKIESKCIFEEGYVDDKDIKDIKKNITSCLNNCESVILKMRFDNNEKASFTIKDYTGERGSGWYNYGADHDVTVTGITEEGIKFATWGYEGFIYFNDMKKGGKYQIDSLDIKIK